MASQEEKPHATGFQHEAIDLRKPSLRLVEVIQSDSADQERLIECEITNTTADTTYNCLSYVWGPETPARIILLNGKPFRVRENLWDFLDVASTSRIRRELKNDNAANFDFESFSGYLWVDALCIDQENTRERNHQVQGMGDIYARAESVLAWFGKHEELDQHFRRAASFISSWYDMTSNRASHSFQNDRIIYGAPFHRMCDAAYSAAEELCKQPYWQRAWITQEAILARKIIYVAGISAMPHATIYDGMRFSSVSWRTNVKPMFAGRNGVKSRPLLENIVRFRKKRCENSLDRVYSLLSTSRTRYPIKVDYDISAFELASAVLKAQSIPRPCFCYFNGVEALASSLRLRDQREQYRFAPRFQLRIAPSLDVDREGDSRESDFYSFRCGRCKAPVTLPKCNDSELRDSIRLYCLACDNESFSIAHIMVSATYDANLCINEQIILCIGKEGRILSDGSISLLRVEKDTFAVFQMSWECYILLGKPADPRLESDQMGDCWSVWQVDSTRGKWELLS